MVKQKLCSVYDCNSPRYCKGYCMKHYYRMKRHGSLDLQWDKLKLCTFNGCDKYRHASGFCTNHYAIFKRNGSPNPTRLWDGKAKERNRKRTENWKKKNWDYYKSYLANRKSRIKIATPKWVKKEELIKFYKNRPTGFHVDHIVPINHPKVCGLHVLWNLQYLTKEENLKKRNEFDINERT